MKVLQTQQNRLTIAQNQRTILAPALWSVVSVARTAAPRKAGICILGGISMVCQFCGCEYVNRNHPQQRYCNRTCYQLAKTPSDKPKICKVCALELPRSAFSDRCICRNCVNAQRRADCAARQKPQSEKVLLRFWSSVDTSGDCWVWMKSKNHRGYGLFSVDGIYRVATRFIYEQLHGPIPNGLLVCHHCDNPSCVRDEHLFLGTTQENALDAKQKGRLASGDRHWTHTKPDTLARGQRNGRRTKPESYKNLIGEAHHKAKLTSHQVLEIRQRYQGGENNKAALAREYQVSATTVRDIVNRRIWQHI